MKSKTCGSCGTEHEGGHPCLMCNVEDSAMTTPNHNEELRPLALKIARGIFSVGDGPFKCTRIQFMSGEWPSHEKAQGGVVEPSLAAIIDEVLKRHDNNSTDDLVEALRECERVFRRLPSSLASGYEHDIVHAIMGAQQALSKHEKQL